MSDIYIYEEESAPPRPDHGNNCHGHFTSISAGGNGHSVRYVAWHLLPIT